MNPKRLAWSGFGWHFLFFGIVLLVLGALRFYRLSDMGIFDDDAVVYITLANNWMDGNINIGAVKPGYHLLGAIAGKLIGMYDDTTLYLNSALDLVGIILLYLLALKAGVNRFLALSAVVIYGCLPTILYENTRGLSHLPAMTFVIGATLAYFYNLDGKRYGGLSLFLCGCCAAFAGMIHPTALAAVPIYPALIAVQNIRKPELIRSLGRVLSDIGIYLLGGGWVILCIIGILALSMHDLNKAWNQFFYSFLGHHSASTQGEGGGLLSRIFALRSIVPELLTPSFLWILLLSAAIGLGTWLKWRQGERSALSRFAAVLWCIVLLYVLINAVVDKGLQSRFLIPIAPLTVLGTFVLLDLGGLVRGNRWFGAAVFVAAVSLSGFNVATHFESVTKPATIFRQMGDQLGTKIDADNRVLFLPSRFWKAMLETMYLPARYVYRLKEPWIPQIGLLKLYRIRYIMIANNLYDHRATKAEVDGAKLETMLMMRWLAENKATKIYQSHELIIFRLNYTDVEGPTQVFTPNFLKFYNSLQADYIGPRFYRLVKTRNIRNFSAV